MEKNEHVEAILVELRDVDLVSGLARYTQESVSQGFVPIRRDGGSLFSDGVMYAFKTATRLLDRYTPAEISEALKIYVSERQKHNPASSREPMLSKHGKHELDDMPPVQA